MRTRLVSAGLADIDDKLQARERLTLEDGVHLFESPDLLAVGYLANRERERLHGARTYFNYNLRLEPTNVCEATCLFCSFSRLEQGMPEAYTMTLEQAWDKLRQRADQPLTEVHVVNGLNPHLPFSYYTDLLRGFKRIRPEIHLKCFTAVEIAYFADLYAMSDEQVMRELMAAGLDSLPGGGAEIFAPRVRKKISADKADADRYLSIHGTAHRLGMKTNVTMLYGHIETFEERVDHMLRARTQQDQSGGFQAFIPLPFLPGNTDFAYLPGPTREEKLRTIAVARLMLDNFAHIKGHWVMLGEEITSEALSFGLDDLSGTLTEERIAHATTVQTPLGLSEERMQNLIRAGGKAPAERDTLYGGVARDGMAASA